jgi:hypothetical protein
VCRTFITHLAFFKRTHSDFRRDHAMLASASDAYCVFGTGCPKGLPTNGLVFTSIKRAHWSCVSVLLVLRLRLLDMVDSP